MISELAHFGDSHERSYATDFVAYLSTARTFVLQCNNPAARLVLGTPSSPWYNFGRIFTIINGGPSNAITIYDESDLATVLHTIAVGDACDVFLISPQSTTVAARESLPTSGDWSASIYRWRFQPFTRL